LKKIPYATQWIEDDDIEAVVSTLRSSNLTQGPKVEEFEKNTAAYCGAKYAVAVNSGTSALHIACLAAGISQGDEIITSPITFVASANCALYCGGRPVFADVQPGTINIDPDDVRKKITPRTKALIPVHFAGNPCEIEKISAIAKENDLLVIEDAAHALGADYKGSKVGSGKFSDMTILSFHPVKHITTGEGGMVLTNDEELYEKLKFFRSHGITRDPRYMKKSDGIWYYEMHELGCNYRITDIQSALGSNQLKKIDRFVARRREIAEKYDREFAAMPGVEVLKQTAGAASSHHLYVVMVDERKRVYDALRDANITVNVHYVPVYTQPYYQKLGYGSVSCPEAEKYYSRCISIPMFPKLSDEDQDFVIARVREQVR
jgi:perosamine synthetase